MTKNKYTLLALGLALTACSTTKYVGEGSYLLTKVAIRVDSLEAEEREELGTLEAFLPQRPNTKLFGLFDWSLGLYSLSNPKSNSFIHRQLRKWGEPPVLYNAEEAEFGRANLTAAMYNKGYLKAQTTLRVDTTHSKQAQVLYTITPGRRLRVDHFSEAISDSSLIAYLHPQDTLQQKRRLRDERYRSYLHSGAILSPQNMRDEQERIMKILRNRGYYTFSGDSIRFEVDTLDASDVWVRSVIHSSEKIYHIGRVRMHQLARKSDASPLSHVHDGISFDLDSKHYIRPEELSRRIWIRPGALYSMQHTASTYTALSELPTLQNVSIQYHLDTLNRDSALLDCDITSVSAQTKSVGGDVVGTNSSGNFGVSSSLNFQNNNLFHGGEQLHLQLRGGYESLGEQRSDHVNYGAEAGLTFPRLLLPFLRTKGSSPIQSSTSLQVSYDYHSRPEFSRDIFSLKWGYSWHSHYTPAYRHQLKVIDLDFLHFGYINEEFRRSMPLITQILNYRDQFVLGASYLFRYNSLNDYRGSLSPWVHNLRLFIQSSGSLLYGASMLLNRQRDDYGAYRFFETNFAQFVKGEIDYSGLRKLNGGDAFAYHLGLAVAYPYGNSRYVPVDLRYFAGGANSLRGWSARSLGPGSMPRSASRSIFDQVGDIKLEMNAEYRMKVLGPLQLALFADAGNIWTIRPYENQPRGDFQWNRFYREIALSSGLGVRWDFDYFVLRFDVGAKIHDPQVENGRPWVITYQDPKQLLAFNIAIGYPF